MRTPAVVRSALQYSTLRATIQDGCDELDFMMKVLGTGIVLLTSLQLESSLDRLTSSWTKMGRHTLMTFRFVGNCLPVLQ